MRRATTHVEYSFSAKTKTNGKLQRGKFEKITKIEHLLEIEKFNVQSVARALHNKAMDRSYRTIIKYLETTDRKHSLDVVKQT